MSKLSSQQKIENIQCWQRAVLKNLAEDQQKAEEVSSTKIKQVKEHVASGFIGNKSVDVYFNVGIIVVKDGCSFYYTIFSHDQRYHHDSFMFAIFYMVYFLYRGKMWQIKGSTSCLH